MVVINTDDGSVRDYKLYRTGEDLRLARPCASYDLATMRREEGWRIIGVSEAAKRLLTAAGLLTGGAPILPRRSRWRTSVPASPARASRVASL